MVYGLLDAVEINGGSTNFMNGFLPEYKEDTSFYKVMILENGLVRGEYLQTIVH